MFATYNGDTPPSYHEKDEVAGFEARLLLSRRRTCTVIDRAGEIYGSRQTAKRTSAGRTWLSMLCARPSVAPLPMTLVSTRDVTRTCNHRVDAYDRRYENIVYDVAKVRRNSKSKGEGRGRSVAEPRVTVKAVGL